MIKGKLLLSICLLFSLFIFSMGQQLVIQNSQRQIILNGPYPLENIFLQFKTHANLKIFKHVVPIKIDQRISKIVFSRSKQGRQPLPYTREQYLYNGQKYALYKVDLNQQFFEEEQGQLYILISYLNRYVNFPEQITMNQDQKFQFYDNKHLISPYTVQSQSSIYKFDKLISYDKDGQVKGVNTVVFKEKNTVPFTVVQHVIHGVNNDPQVYFTDVERIIQVSHWGNIAITQFYKLKNFGPSLKGQFSRVAFGSLQHGNVKNAFKGIEAQLPYQTWGLYYRDQVGNISTSKAYRDQYQNKVRFGLVPRFSLLGGWKCNWQVGYNLPTTKHLYNDGNKFQMDNIELEYTLEKIVSENYHLKIILPEGATNVVVKIAGQTLTPTKIQKSFGYLDFFGKPTYVFENYREPLKKKVIVIDYQLDTLSTLYKPIVLFAAIFSILAIFIVVKRLKLEAFKEDKSE